MRAPVSGIIWSCALIQTQNPNRVQGRVSAPVVSSAPSPQALPPSLQAQPSALTGPRIQSPGPALTVPRPRPFVISSAFCTVLEASPGRSP